MATRVQERLIPERFDMVTCASVGKVTGRTVVGFRPSLLHLFARKGPAVEQSTAGGPKGSEGGGDQLGDRPKHSLFRLIAGTGRQQPEPQVAGRIQPGQGPGGARVAEGLGGGALCTDSQAPA